MFNFKKFKLSREVKEPAPVLKNKNEAYDEIDINTLLYLVKYGNEINLKIRNDDIYEDNAVLALGRTLELDGIRVCVSQWAEWTTNITLIHMDKELKVAEICIPNEDVDWNRDDNFVIFYSKLKWLEKGPWCKEIYDNVNSLKCEIDKKRKEAEEAAAIKDAKEKAILENENARKRAYFESLYK